MYLTAISQTCRYPADVVIALDDSTGVVAGDPTYNNWYIYMINFAVRLIQGFNVTSGLDRIGLLTYDDTPNIAFYLNTFQTNEEIVQQTRELQIEGGNTGIGAALKAVRTQMFTRVTGARTEGASRILFLVFEDSDTVNYQSAVSEANLTRLAGIDIFAIAVRPTANEDFIKTIASSPSHTRAFRGTGFQNISDLVPTLLNYACYPYTTTTSTTPRSTTSGPSTLQPPTTGEIYCDINGERSYVLIYRV